MNSQQTFKNMLYNIKTNDKNKILLRGVLWKNYVVPNAKISEGITLRIPFICKKQPGGTAP